ncbi:MAG: glycosyltransferase [Alphaproteobacteria bacterium]|nr:MAG: glycosyltransferase [Alphaproteobacteria bacterium]
MRLAFYAPMKSPDHPVPSGDRRMARLLQKALKRAGHEVTLASEFRSFEGKGDPARQEALRMEGEAEAARLIEKWRAEPENMPEGWFTYHLYHKAPDWIGPVVARTLGIPYFVAEASHAPKRAKGPWAMGYEAAEKAIRDAQRIFHMTRLDGECLAPLAKYADTLVYLPPFLDTDAFDAEAIPVDIAPEILAAGGAADKHTLLSVAMMRHGDKLQSYQALALSLTHLARSDWQLLVIGDGEAEAEVRECLKPLGPCVAYLGRRALEELPAWYSAADLYVWPAVNEAYGMAFLEAGASGLPVVACRLRGVPDVVREDETGLLVSPEDPMAFAGAIESLLGDAKRRAGMSAAARNFVRQERTLDHAAAILKVEIGRGAA